MSGMGGQQLCFVPLDEAAEELNMEESTLRKLIADGVLTPTSTGLRSRPGCCSAADPAVPCVNAPDWAGWLGFWV